MASLNARVSNRKPFSFVAPPGEPMLPQHSYTEEPGFREGWIHFAALNQGITYHHVSGYSFTPRSRDAQWLVNLDQLGYPFSIVCNRVLLIEQNVWQFIPIISGYDIAGTPLHTYIHNQTGAIHSYLPSIINNGNGYQGQRFGGKKTKAQTKALKETPKKVKEAPKKAPKEAPKKSPKEAPKKSPKEAPKKAPKQSKAPSKPTKKP
jgi:hypothetical protein